MAKEEPKRSLTDPEFDYYDNRDSDTPETPESRAQVDRMRAKLGLEPLPIVKPAGAA